MHSANIANDSGWAVDLITPVIYYESITILSRFGIERVRSPELGKLSLILSRIDLEIKSERKR